LYAQDSDESHFSTGVYSVKNDKWITAPSKEKSQIDKEVFKTKINSWKEKIENLIKNIKKDGIKSSEKQIDSLKEKLKDYRKSGLEKEGEYSYENLVFKYLRRSKLIEKLYNTIVKQTDKELSVETRKIE
jgi:Txe/YoeB family toxin of Txe-Axe toxin-antitoxin module